MNPMALNNTTLGMAVSTISSAELLPAVGHSIRIANNGNADCFVAVTENVGDSVNIPTDGTSVKGTYIMAKSIEVFSIPATPLYILAISEANTSLMIQVGEGV